jgi:hypothetical protein
MAKTFGELAGMNDDRLFEKWARTRKILLIICAIAPELIEI